MIIFRIVEKEKNKFAFIEVCHTKPSDSIMEG
jgi:hypothetical protein